MFDDSQNQNTQAADNGLPQISNVKPSVPSAMPTIDNRPVPPLSDTSDASQPALASTGNNLASPATNSLSQNPALAAGAEDNSDLQNIKTAALQNLAPLVDKLNLTPEEKFKTLMMLIQSSDNKDYVQKAYEAANGISDETQRAKALLDIINEINYLTKAPKAK